MIVAEFQTTPFGSVEYGTVATLTMNDDGSGTMDDLDGLFETSTDAVVPGAPRPAGSVRNVAFADDPAIWARHAHTIYGGGPARVRIVTDGGTPPGAASR